MQPARQHPCEHHVCNNMHIRHAHLRTARALTFPLPLPQRLNAARRELVASKLGGDERTESWIAPSADSWMSTCPPPGSAIVRGGWRGVESDADIDADTGAVEADAGAAGVGRGGAGVVAVGAVAPVAVAALGSAGRGTWKMMACP